MGKGELRMSLRELRAYTGRTQVEAAGENEMTQSELSRLERREDFLLSTLRRYVDSLGGTLEVRVMLGSSEIKLNDGERKERGWEMKPVGQALETLASLEEWLRPAGGRARLPEAKLEGCGAQSPARAAYGRGTAPGPQGGGFPPRGIVGGSRPGDAGRSGAALAHARHRPPGGDGAARSGAAGLSLNHP
jgi:Helix-turn-helix domain